MASDELLDQVFSDQHTYTSDDGKSGSVVHVIRSYLVVTYHCKQKLTYEDGSTT